MSCGIKYAYLHFQKGQHGHLFIENLKAKFTYLNMVTVKEKTYHGSPCLNSWLWLKHLDSRHPEVWDNSDSHLGKVDEPLH